MFATHLCAAVVMTFGMSSSQNRLACKIMPTIVEQAEQKGIDPFIFTSLIFHESAFRPRVVSSAGACGLTQVLPQYSDYTCDQLKKPKTSIKAGMIALSYWLTRAKGDLVHGLCGYNAGNVCINNKKSVRVRHVKRVYSKSIVDLALELRLEVVDRFMDDEHRFYNKVTDDNID